MYFILCLFLLLYCTSVFFGMHKLTKQKLVCRSLFSLPSPRPTDTLTCCTGVLPPLAS